jgi:hypothetical protein
VYSRNDDIAEIIEDSIWRRKRLNICKNEKVINTKKHSFIRFKKNRESVKKE